MMLNCFGINKLHGFMKHSVMLAICRISRENYYSFQFSNFRFPNILFIYLMGDELIWVNLKICFILCREYCAFCSYNYLFNLS